MKFKDYITEDKGKPIEDPREFAKVVKQNCGPYLKLIKQREPMQRGMVNYDISMGVKRVMIARKPKGTPKDVFRIMNKWLEEKGGARRDRSVICTSKLNTRIHGSPHWIFPVGKFKYSFIRTRDLNWAGAGWNPAVAQEYFRFLHDQDQFKWAKQTGDLKKLSADFSLDYIEWLKKHDVEKFFEFNKNFDEAYNKGYETWFECSRYYYVNIDDKRRVVVEKELKLFV